MSILTKDYPCELKTGDIVRTRGGRTREVSKIDGRYIYFTDGSQFSFSHPDIECVIVPKDKTHKKSKRSTVVDAEESSESNETES